MSNYLGRLAEINNYKEVRRSGYLNRKISLLCVDTLLSESVEDCGSTNYVNLFVDSKKTLERLKYRWHLHDDRLVMIRGNEDYLLDESIQLRSPMTCASHDGHICKKCFGEMYDFNKHIHIGILSTLNITSQTTQKLLSTKHLLQSNVQILDFEDDFYTFFNVSNDEKIYLNTPCQLLIDLSDIDDVRMLDKMSLDGLSIISDGETIDTDLPVSVSLHPDLLKKIEPSIKIGDSSYLLDLVDDEQFVFSFEVNNVGANDTLYRMIKLIDNKNAPDTTYHMLLQKFILLINEIGIHCMAAHAEVILRNLIRSSEDVKIMPDWSKPDPEYVIKRLTDAILISRSPIVSFSFERIAKQFSDPSTFKKSHPSLLDNLFK